MRTQTGDSPTDYQYTGQRSYLDSLGLHYYVARWYDPVTAHFTQADTIIPSPGNSGDWDRYAYVNYNPINFNDPTGHGQNSGDDYDPADMLWYEEREFDLMRASTVATETRKVAMNHDGDALERFAAASDYAASEFSNHAAAYMKTMDLVFGHQGNGLNTDDITGRNTLGYFFTLINQEGNPTEVDWNYSVIAEEVFENSSGLSEEFQDPNEFNNQIHHIYFGFQLGYHHGVAIGQGANIYHEFIQTGDGGNLVAGASIQDFHANCYSVVLGNQLYWGTIKPADVGNAFLSIFGENYSSTEDYTFWK